LLGTKGYAVVVVGTIWHGFTKNSFIGEAKTSEAKKKNSFA